MKNARSILIRTETMANEVGYVALYRKSISSSVMKNANLWMFWCYCLMKATQKPYNALVGHIVVPLEPGQFIFGRRAASKELPLSERAIRTCLSTLLNLGKVTQQTTSRYSVITIPKFSAYQVTYGKNDQKYAPIATHQRPTDDHVQEYNNRNNSNKGGGIYKFVEKEDKQLFVHARSLQSFSSRKKEYEELVDKLSQKYNREVMNRELSV